MSYDDDDESDLDEHTGRSKNKPKDKPDYTHIDANGKLTSDGESSVWFFGKTCLIHDDSGFVSMSAIEKSFETHVLGFPLDRISDNRFSEIIQGEGPQVSKHPHLKFEYCEIEPWDNGLRARLVGRLGATPFDPTSDEATAVEYLVDKLLPLHGVNMFVAKPGALKTWLAYRIAIDVSQGRPVLGRFDVKKGRAVLVDFEIGSKEAKRRLRMLGADGRVIHTSHPTNDLNDEQFWADLETFRPFVENSKGSIVPAEWLVVIDGLGSGRRNGEFGELDSRFAAPLGRAARFAEQRGATFVFIHHTPKAGSLADVESLFSGTGAIRRGVDSAFYFRRLSDGPNGEERAEVISAKSRKGTAPDNFKIQLTNDLGLELFERDEVNETTATELEPSDDEKILGAVVAEPGCSGNRIAESLEMTRQKVTATLKELEQAGRIRAEAGGKGRATLYFVTETSAI